MPVLHSFKNFSQRAMADSVSWGTLIVFALAMGLFVLILLSFSWGWFIQASPDYS